MKTAVVYHEPNSRKAVHILVKLYLFLVLRGMHKRFVHCLSEDNFLFRRLSVFHVTWSFYSLN